MTQPDLFSAPRSIVDIANENAGQLSAEFLQWLPENQHIWQAFVAETMKIISRGYDHYSAKTIVEFLRHHSALAEVGSQWKINNNTTAYLSRLFDIACPQHAGLFEYRITTKQKGAA